MFQNSNLCDMDLVDETELEDSEESSDVDIDAAVIGVSDRLCIS
jgi:hypothetical protein